MNIVKFIDGFKSYLLGGVAILSGTVMLLNGDYVHGAEAIYGGLTTVFIRHAIAKTGK